MRRPLLWAIAGLVLWVTDIVVLAATGRIASGENDDALQILGFWIFQLCPAVLLIPDPCYTRLTHLQGKGACEGRTRW